MEYELEAKKITVKLLGCHEDKMQNGTVMSIQYALDGNVIGVDQVRDERIFATAASAFSEYIKEKKLTIKEELDGETD